MYYPKAKVYFDGSHYIAIPHTTQSWKKRKNKNKTTNDKLKMRFEDLNKEYGNVGKKERKNERK